MDFTKGRQAVERVTNVVFLKAYFLMYYYILLFTDLMNRCFFTDSSPEGEGCCPRTSI